MNETALPNDVDSLKALLLKAQDQISNQASKITDQAERIKDLELTIKDFARRRFASTSERWEGQTLLFDEAEQQSEKPKEIEIKAFKRKKKAGRKPLPADIPRVEKRYKLAEDARCSCGCEYRVIDELASETLDIIPAKMQVIRHVREKGVCPSCDGSFKTAEMPKQPIPRSIASPALLAHITTCKYVDGLPLYRQEEILRRIGVDIPRATLANWMIKLSELVKPLINLIRERIIESPVITMDETHVQVLKEKGKKASSRSFMWVMVGHDSGKKAVIFEYSSSRKSEVALRMLQEFEGTLVSDGYSAYPFVARVLGLRHAGCWDHARRKFIEAAKGIKGEQGLAVEALNLINALYRVERNYKDEGVEQLHRARSIYSWSILRHLRKWLDRHLPDITPRSQTGKAMHYLANEWERLVVFLEDGCIPVSNQAAENAVRPFVIGRKAWLFSASTKGAEASASLYSLVETAKANGIEPFSYLKKIFTELPAAETIEDIEKLLPWHK